MIFCYCGGHRAMAKSSSVVCRVCCRQFSQYTCPRCNCPYCSLACYKKHGGKCTEEFYRENIQQCLKSTHAKEKDRFQVVQALKRMHSEEEPSGMDLSRGDEGAAPEKDDWTELVSEDQFKQIIEACTSDDTSALETLLPDHVLKQFLMEVNRGGVQNLIQPWTPWWEASEAAAVRLSASGMALISNERNFFGDENVALGDIPPPPTDRLPRLDTIIKVAVSPNLKWQLVNLLYCYCYLMRFYNGDISTDILECSGIALSLSSCLAASSQAPTSLEETIGELFEKTAPEFKGAAALGVLQDVQKLLELGRSAVILSLSHFKTAILESAKNILQNKHKGAVTSGKKSRRKNSKGSASPNELEEISEGVGSIRVGDGGEQVSGLQNDREAVRKLRSGVHKVWFMMIWANEQEGPMYSETAERVRLAVLDLSRGMANNARPQNHDVAVGEVKIEEI
ncbi:hypothetical protein BSKO_07412 [Bryopsis sp. KO-2023]|nr:hypothetical protein BSKO_07412 [Bryopsis sp. KO-2023]